MAKTIQTNTLKALLALFKYHCLIQVLILSPGIDRLCACTSQGRLYFYQVSEDVPDQSDSALEGDLTPTSDLADHNLQPEGSNSDEMLEASPKASGMLV